MYNVEQRAAALIEMREAPEDLRNLYFEAANSAMASTAALSAAILSAAAFFSAAFVAAAAAAFFSSD